VKIRLKNHRKTYYLIIFLFFTQIIISQQIKRETRAVWVSTNFGLDWPPKTYDAQIQKETLRTIFKNIHDKHFNTVYFQVRSNATVMYNSSIEPYSPYLTGIVGGIPDYDPLKFAIKLGKEYGLEVHAWLNMMRCFSGENKSFLLSPLHITNIHPEWINKSFVNGKITYWLNAGLFEVQEYLTRILLEIALNYDVDGIQLDYFRYPAVNFNDENEYNKFAFGTDIANWRRNNLTKILKEFKQRVRPKNPFLKIGVTPIGIRENMKGATGLEGFHSVYQDTERWLKESLVDYMVPQIYWPFENNPDFGILAQDWVTKSYGKNIVLGLAAYKPNVKNEIKMMIDFSRKINAAGIAIFRYENISNIDNLYFNNIAFPKNMEWKYNNDEVLKYKKEKIKWRITSLDSSEINIHLQNNSKVQNNIRYLVLNNLSGEKKKKIKLIKPSIKNIKIKLPVYKQLLFSYGIEKIDRLWNKAAFVDTINIEVPYLLQLKNSADVPTKPAILDNNIISIFLHKRQNVVLQYFNDKGAIKQEKKELNRGYNFITCKNLRSIKSIKLISPNGNLFKTINLF